MLIPTTTRMRKKEKMRITTYYSKLSVFVRRHLTVSYQWAFEMSAVPI